MCTYAFIHINTTRKKHKEPNDVQGLSAVTVSSKSNVQDQHSNWTMCAPLDVDSYYSVSINPAHSDITINISSQKEPSSDILKNAPFELKRLL